MSKDLKSQAFINSPFSRVLDTAFQNYLKEVNKIIKEEKGDEASLIQSLLVDVMIDATNEELKDPDKTIEIAKSKSKATVNITLTGNLMAVSKQLDAMIGSEKIFTKVYKMLQDSAIYDQPEFHVQAITGDGQIYTETTDQSKKTKPAIEVKDVSGSSAQKPPKDSAN